jgi:hypothetical protein
MRTIRSNIFKERGIGIMPRKEYGQNEFVKEKSINKLIRDAKAAFDALQDIAREIERVAKLNQYTGDEEDDQYIEEIATIDSEANFDEMDEEEPYYSRKNSRYAEEFDRMDSKEESYFGRKNGRNECEWRKSYEDEYQKKEQPHYYPCKCKECDKLKSKAYANLVLGLNDLKDTFDILDLAKDKFEEAVDSLKHADKYFEKARCCSIRYGCHYYCKTRCGCKHKRPVRESMSY